MLIAIPDEVTEHDKKKYTLKNKFGIVYLNPKNILSIEYDGVDTTLQFDAGYRIVSFVYGGGDCTHKLKVMIHRQESSTGN